MAKTSTTVRRYDDVHGYVFVFLIVIVQSVRSLIIEHRISDMSQSVIGIIITAKIELEKPAYLVYLPHIRLLVLLEFYVTCWPQIHGTMRHQNHHGKHMFWQELSSY